MKIIITVIVDNINKSNPLISAIADVTENNVATTAIMMIILTNDNEQDVLCIISRFSVQYYIYKSIILY